MPTRLFVALDLPAPAAQAVAALCTGLPGARWSDPAQLHLTLRFMAAVPDANVAALAGRLGVIRHAAFSLSLHGVGVFPSGRKPARVLWAGVTPAEPVLRLKSVIDGVIDGVIGPDDEAARGFHPHLTLARFREPPGSSLAAYLIAHEGFTSAPWVAGAFLLYRSILGARGARHELLRRYALDGG
jgi:2'-5' RNA ligase